MAQYFNSEVHGEVVFIDLRQNHHSAKCQPRDITVLEGPDSPKLREEIAIDIRIGQGISPVGVAKGLLHQ